MSRKSGREHEDMVLVVAELDGGIMVNHLVNWLSPLKGRSTAVIGERGCFMAETLIADLTYYANGAIYANGAMVADWEALRNFRGGFEGDVTRYAIANREPLLVEHEQY